MAVSLVPANSLAAVATKSAGAILAQEATVTGGTSGDESRPAKATTSNKATTVATVASLRMS